MTMSAVRDQDGSERKHQCRAEDSAYSAAVRFALAAKYVLFCMYNTVV
jgi:hypothetical protein